MTAKQFCDWQTSGGTDDSAAMAGKKQDHAAMTTEYIYGINPAFEVVRARHRAIRAAYFGPSGASGSRRRKLTELLNEAKVPVTATD